MALFKNNNGLLSLVNIVQPKSEKELQRLVEANLKDVLDMHFLASEYRTSSGRIDTLAVDCDGAPVVIEYKRNRNDNVINQSLSYLRWLTEQQPEFFEMLMQRQLNEEVFKNIRLDWKHPRVICIAESFSQFDIDTVKIVPLRIELFKYRLYEGGVLSIEPINVDDGRKYLLGTSTLLSVDGPQSLIQSIKEQSTTSHLIGTLFDELRARILSLDDDVVEKVGKRCISYRLTKNFAELQIKKDRISIDLRPIDYLDPQCWVEKICEGYTVTMNRRISFNTANELEYAFGLIEQSYKNVL